MKSGCDECPMKICNPKGYCLNAIGNPAFQRLIVVPCVDKSAYKHGDMTFSDYVEIIRDALFPLTGGLDGYMVAPMVRCMPTSDIPINDDIIYRCAPYIIKDIKDNNIKKVIFLGESSRMMNIQNIRSASDVIYVKNGIGYSVSYSPLTKKVDYKLYLEFVRQLREWYSASKFNNYNGMRIIKI